MTPSTAAQVESLRSMTVAELREKYAEVFGEATTSRHKDYLRRRIVWRLQANEEGGLSERALRRAAELANDADLRMLGPKSTFAGAPGRTAIGPVALPHDRRLPMPGTVLTREYRGLTIAVTVLEKGFECEGVVYRSLTAVARAITGTHWNGFHFFQLAAKAGER